jgi:hypothetical protein
VGSLYNYSPLGHWLPEKKGGLVVWVQAASSRSQTAPTSSRRFSMPPISCAPHLASRLGLAGRCYLWHSLSRITIARNMLVSWSNRQYCTYVSSHDLCAHEATAGGLDDDPSGRGRRRIQPASRASGSRGTRPLGR